MLNVVSKMYVRGGGGCEDSAPGGGERTVGGSRATWRPLFLVGSIPSCLLYQHSAAGPSPAPRTLRNTLGLGPRVYVGD